ncbi:lantibiotic dehydratase [Streptomyces sp. Vc74B-19]|uniref:lantibiotic dehydratase n=1 Tax=unclassified Streptomyces TaxID=2593676 RepID=UPI001BFC8C34|nr:MULTISPECIES: lantibiotic dehydratase [unclassified Streptomyces]MBT3164745.1 lantibiotic dehydratase [Streptomyces sp. Vc74B-19]MCO4698873.1 lantibiotic dehydratase [Streptomyces sp. RO-S4]
MAAESEAHRAFAAFEVREPVLVRMASRPRGTVLAGVDAADPVPGARRLASDPLLGQAVRVASGSPAHSLDRLTTDEGVAALGRKRTLSAARTLTRYARRAAARPTPFGLFAGVGRARFGSAAKAEPGTGEVAVRLDGAWLRRRVLAWLADPSVRRRVDVVLNDLCFLRDGRLHLRTGGQEQSVRDNALVGAVREQARTLVPYARLLASLAERFPSLDVGQLDRQLAELIRHGFLLTSITPHRIDTALLDGIGAVLDGALPDDARALREIRAACARHQEDSPGLGGDSWHRLLDKIRRLDLPGADGDTHGRPPVHVDLRIPGEFVVPEAVGQEVCRYAGAIWAITPEWTTLSYMRDYRDRFIERYGTACAVPMGELADPHRGLGLPPEYGSKPAYARTGPGDEADGPRRALVGELIQEAVLSGGDLVLTDDVVRRLADVARHDPGAVPPRGLELCFQVLSESTAALDRGDFQLLGSPHIGSWAAGATAGRFAEAAGLAGELSRLASETSGTPDGEVLAAQVELMPREPRGLNIVQVPRLLPYRIPVGVPDDRDDPRCLDWRSLLVAAGSDGLRLLHPDSGRPVRPVLPHMLALDTQAPPVARFLMDVATARPRVWSGWDWAGHDTLPYLPRVRYGRVVAMPKRWLPGRRLRDAARAKGAKVWEEGLDAWRRRLVVPDRLQIARNDQMYPVDLRERWDRDLLRAELTAPHPQFVLHEDLTADGAGLGWNGGHSTEIVVPLAGARPSGERPAAAGDERTRTAPPVRPAPSRFHLPGEDWLFVKWYAEPSAHGALLADHLPAVLAEVEDDVDRWFFVRYQDPEPHLRLRFHGEPAALNGRVLPALSRASRGLVESGAVRSMSLDTYRPESDRYGGEALQEAAERLFRTDSLSAIVQVRAARGAGRAFPADVLAGLGHAVLLESLGDWDWCGWVDRIFTKSAEHEVYQRQRALADRLIRPGSVVASAVEALRAPALGALWSESPEPRAYGQSILSAPEADRDEALLSLLHMRHNRQFGIDRSAETRGYAVLRGAVRSHLGRRRHGGGGGNA